MLGPAEEGPPGTAWALLATSLEEQKRRDRRWRLGGPWPAAQSTALPAAWRATPSATLKVDLGADLDSIFAAFKPAARKAIRRAERDGITTRRVDSAAELERYTEFAMACAARYGKRNVARADYHLCWQLLRTPPCHFETFYAEHAGETIAGLSVWGFGSETGELGSFQSERAFREKLYGPDLLKWRVIQWARGEGLGAYDLAGVHPTRADGKEASIRRFKEKWGGSRYDNLLVQG
jgi:lipid II:glycine glycyltransferase (peptidoglycan interpeptide bridge formation enzyme)